MQNPRQIAFLALREVHRRGAFADAALDRAFGNSQLNDLDRRLVTELVYGSVRRMRSIDFIIDKLATKKSSQQPPRTPHHLTFRLISTRISQPDSPLRRRQYHRSTSKRKRIFRTQQFCQRFVATIHPFNG